MYESVCISVYANVYDKPTLISPVAFPSAMAWWFGSNGYMMVVRIQRIYDGGSDPSTESDKTVISA